MLPLYWLTNDRPDATSATRIRRLGAMMAVLSLGLIVVPPVVVLLSWAFSDPGALAQFPKIPPEAIQGPVLWPQRALGALFSLIPIACFALGMWQARRCFLGFTRGEVFTAKAVRGLRRFASWMFVYTLASLIEIPLNSVVLTLHNPQGKQLLTFGMGSEHVFSLFFAATVWLMAAIIGHGQALADENAAFV